MIRMTRVKDEWPCRIAGGCPAEEWIEDLEYDLDEMTGHTCANCPFEIYINKLAEYEDEKEKMEDDLK